MATNIIYNRKKLGRIVSFQGLPHVGTCSPADIDICAVHLCVEIKHLLKYMIGNFKEHGKTLQPGERLLLERHCQAFKAIHYTAIAFVAWHPPEVEEIDAAQSTVVKCYWKGVWRDRFVHESLLNIYCRFFGIPIPDDK